MKYSKLENCQKINDIEHPIIKELLLYFDKNPYPQIEISSLTDIPSGTGLGSSGTFTTSLIKSLSDITKY